MKSKLTYAQRKARNKRSRDRANRLAKLRYALLIKLLGNQCAWCEDDGTNGPLTVDHVNGRAQANHHALTRSRRWSARVVIYWREYENGIQLQVLCHSCNSKDGRARQLAKEALPDAPF